MIKLISNGCPKCLILKDKLTKKGLEFIEEDDIQLLLDNGMRSYPALMIESEFMDFGNAMQWINKI